MSCMPYMTSLVAAVARHMQVKIIQNVLCVFERGENWLQNGILHFNCQKNCQKCVTKLEYTQT